MAFLMHQLHAALNSLPSIIAAGLSVAKPDAVCATARTGRMLNRIIDRIQTHPEPEPC